MTTIVKVENLNYNELNLNYLGDSEWKKMGIKLGSNAITNDIIVVDSLVKIICLSLFFKSPLRRNLLSKILNLNIQPLLEHIFMHVNVGGLNPQGDYNQAYSVK